MLADDEVLYSKHHYKEVIAVFLPIAQAQAAGQRQPVQDERP